MHDCIRVCQAYFTASHAGGTGSSVPFLIKLDGRTVYNQSTYFGYSSNAESLVGAIGSRLQDLEHLGGLIVRANNTAALTLLYPALRSDPSTGLEVTVNNTVYSFAWKYVNTAAPLTTGPLGGLIATTRAARAAGH